MTINPTLPLRIVQAVFATVVLGLTAYVAHWWSGYWHDFSPAEIDLLLFTSIWSILSLAYLVLVPLLFQTSAANHKYGIFGAEALTMIFWFAGFVSLAVFLSNRVCFGHVCNVAKAAVVFASLEWAVFAATFVMAALHVWRTRNTRSTRPHPEMTIRPEAAV